LPKDKLRRHLDRRIARFNPAFHKIQGQPRAFFSELNRRLAHGGQRRISILGIDGVVESGDRHVVGYRKTPFPQPFHQAQGHAVVSAYNYAFAGNNAVRQISSGAEPGFDGVIPLNNVPRWDLQVPGFHGGSKLLPADIGLLLGPGACQVEKLFIAVGSQYMLHQLLHAAAVVDLHSRNPVHGDLDGDQGKWIVIGAETLQVG
jgi:hypothetical protein